MRRGILGAIVFGAIAVPLAFGYNGETITASGQTTQITHPDASNLQFYLDASVVAGATTPLTTGNVITSDSNPTAAVEAAMANWNNVGAANVHFNALQTTSAGHNSGDCQNVISIASSAADVSVLGGPTGIVAVTVNSFVNSAGASPCGGGNIAAGTIIDSDILLNPYYQFSTTAATNTKDVQAVITHELGHVLGLNHSSLLAATMYPFTARFQRHLSWDEKAFAAQYYPSGKQTLGTISGTATVAGGGPIKYGLITATDLTPPPAGGKVICGLTAADGTYSIQVPAGLYNVYVEPFNSFVGPSNIYSLATGTGILDPTQVTTNFQATFAGGNSTTGATQLTVTAGSSSTANITAIAGATPLAVPIYGIGAAGANGGISSFSSIGGAIQVTGNTSFDLALSGPGIDSTIVIYYIGTNVTVVGSPRVDPSGTVNGNPIIRQTLQIGSQTNSTMGTLWITKGTNVLPLTGFLDIEPMTPGINNVQDAESARTSITSGQWAAVYGNSLANTTRTWNANTDFTGGVAPNSPLPLSLDGVSVTVNGVPAGVYFVCNTCSPNQVNFVTPSGLTAGSATVVVNNQGSASGGFKTTVVQASPSFFYYPAGSSLYPLAVHISDGKIVGDPAALSTTEKAHPGETIEMFVNGIAPATGGIIVPVTAFTQQVSVSAGATPLSVSAPYLVAAGEFQINVTLPSTLAAGNYTLSMSVPGGSTADSGVTITLPVGP